MTITCGIDWAEGHHDVALLDADGRRIAKLRIDTGLTGFTELMTLLAEHATDPTSVSVAIETDKVLIVAALRAAGFDVYAINPRAVARYRERWGQAGGKSDRGDALVLANVLRTDRHLLGVIFHADRGRQYTSTLLASLAGDVGVRLSVGKGQCRGQRRIRVVLRHNQD